jgi:hypothetical protein
MFDVRRNASRPADGLREIVHRPHPGVARNSLAGRRASIRVVAEGNGLHAARAIRRLTKYFAVRPEASRDRTSRLDVFTQRHTKCSLKSSAGQTPRSENNST